MNEREGFHKTIHRLIRDDKSALDEIYRIYYPRLYSFSKSFLKVEDDIPDILQEVFVKLWMNRRQISNVDTFNAWLYTIAINLIVTYFREKIKEREFGEKMKRIALNGDNPVSPDLEYNDLREYMDKIIAQLPSKRRQIFILSRHDGLSNREIAEHLGISIKTVEDHITHALRYLKMQLNEKDLLFSLFLIIYLWFFRYEQGYGLNSA